MELTNLILYAKNIFAAGNQVRYQAGIGIMKAVSDYAIGINAGFCGDIG